jgi:hypothetical protein
MPATSHPFRNLTASRSASLRSRKSRMMLRQSRSKSCFSSATCSASIRPLRANTVNLCRADLSILKVIGCRRDALPCGHPATDVRWVQSRGHMQPIENRRLERRSDDEISANAEFSGVRKGGTYYYSEINLCFLIFNCLIFESNVDRGIPSFAAAPSEPATFPLHSANAVSIISLS